MSETAVRSSITFRLDQEEITVQGISPTTTVLNFLRDHLGRKGSKEGCAEGDCGACTVVIADLHRGQLRYRPVNACIQFLPLLDGKQLYTVESLRPAPGELHPVQQALVDCHASQCGFCTPGFVMSLFAFYKNHASASREQLTTALSGNLCRCTGYRPIIEAGQVMYDYAQAIPAPEMSAMTAPAGNPVGQDVLIKQLQALAADPRSVALVHGQQRFFAPKTLVELAGYLAAYPDAVLLAGGTDVGLWVSKQHRDIATLVYLGNIAELATLTEQDGWLYIGAAVLLEDAYTRLVQHYPVLQDLHSRFASLPIRSAGTLVGNVANGSPIGDSMPLLLALDAHVVLRKGDETRELALEAFYLGYQQTALQAGEFVQAVRVPLPSAGRALRSYKISKRFGQDISAVCGAFCVALENGRVSQIRMAFGGMAAIPARAYHTEDVLRNQPWDKASVEQAMQALASDFSPLSDLRASAHYRMQVARNLLLKFYLQTAEPAVQTGVTRREVCV